MRDRDDLEDGDMFVVDPNSAAGTITLEAVASAVDDYYNDMMVKITSGTGAGQARAITDYNGTTKVATISPNWSTNPDNTSVYHVVYQDRCSVGAVYDKTGYELSAAGVDDILDEVVEGTTTMRQMLRGFASFMLSKVSGGGTATITFRDIGDTKDRIEATVTGVGDRSSMTLDLS